MPKLTWTVLSGATDITSKILSMNIQQGRDKYLDPYSGGSCTLTINNAGDYASGITYGTPIKVSTNGTLEFNSWFWVQEVTFNDYPGNTGLNTATITAVDWMSRAGRILANAFSIASGDCATQADAFEQSAGGPLPADMVVLPTGPFGSLASATTYTGSVNNYFNLLMATERGSFFTQIDRLIFLSRSYVGASVIATTLGPTTSATQIAYSDVQRIQNGTQFINTATVSPDGLASQTVVNSASVTTYGAASYSSSTVDSTTTQAQGNAGWVANSFADPSALRFQCSLTDVAQNATALSSWMSQCWGSDTRAITLSYRIPGGSLTSVNVVLEGWDINVTPAQTIFNLSYSPLTYYQFFTLNSTTLGILDTSRLGWGTYPTPP